MEENSLFSPEIAPYQPMTAYAQLIRHLQETDHLGAAARLLQGLKALEN